MKIFSAAQLYQADQITEQNQEISSTELMERAGGQIFNWLHQRLQGAQVPIHLFCGIGKNGGDGMVVSRLLIENGYQVKTYIVNYSDKRAKDFLINYDRVKNVTKAWPLLMTSEEEFPQIGEKDIIVDAMFGIGINRAPEGWVKKLIQYINSLPSFKLSVDMPSGLPANEAVYDMEAVIKSSHVLTFQTPKLSFFLPETGKFAPFFEVLDIGLDRKFLNEAKSFADIIAKPEAQNLYQQRAKFSHKGDYGHTLVIAGSYGKMGAALLATKAAFRVGAGKVTNFSPTCGYTILQSSIPEAMVVTDENEKHITNIEVDFEPTAIAVGMGIGTNDTTIKALEALFKTTKATMVIDADGINCMAQNKALLKALPERSILTPHPGELKSLLGEWTDDYDKIEKAKAFVKKHNIILVIKGANTIVIAEDELYINTTGNPGMATAGSGDVLSGAIAGLVSQGYDPLVAAVFGVYLHGSSGNIVSQAISYEGTMAGDIADAIGEAYLELFREEKPAQEKQG